ncbi:MAG TPA: hypothetical protein PLP22_04690 [Candidatus Competibacter sp.]|nr:hypothetical protein [Candidatus Competibacteraceae bacterium]HRE54075.1 hypothetical protein [Candidatus Competibacter sp.]HUM95382.1 hypothetical protein [Candidatus Competibacter sp.]
MSIYLYYSLIPEALIASMLPPEKFGQYYATGHKFKSKGQAVFFEVDPDYRHPYFDIDGCYKRCVARADGSPKNSIYVSMYRVTEHLAIDALGKMYLTTAMGETLGLSRGDALPKVEKELHMYQDLAPINSLVVSVFDPAAYYADVVTAPSHSFRFPGMCFVELELGMLAVDPANGKEGDLPYSFMQHLREALMELEPVSKQNKLVHRVHSLEFPFRMVKNGFYMGIGDELVYYPMLSPAALRKDHSNWWRSANL